MTTQKFKDHFSVGTQQYSRYRPQYPEPLFQYLSSLTGGHQRAWDCATGTGQAAVNLAQYYAQVIATDASKAQIEKATPQKAITYKVAVAESSGIDANSVDLITVAQALHWFDLENFAKEARRVLKYNGVLAAWTYGLAHIRQDIDDVVNHLYGPVLDRYWPEERNMIEEGYRNIQLPFREGDSPVFHMSHQWNLEQLTGYLKTWSAVRNYQREHNKNPVDECYPQLRELWGDPDRQLTVTWPLTVKIWLK